MNTFPLWPLVSGVLAGVYLADGHGMALWLPLVMIGMVFAAVVRSKHAYLLAAGLIAGYLSHGSCVQRQSDAMSALGNKTVIANTHIQGVITDTGKHGIGPYLLKVQEAEHLPAQSRVLLSSPKHKPINLQYGDVISVSAKLTRIETMRNPHGFNQATWLHRRGADLVCHTQTPPTVLNTSWKYTPHRVFSKWRHHVRQMITSGIDPNSYQAELIRAVTLGERPSSTSTMIQDFRESGTLHVFAVSGLHFGMVGVIIGTTFWFLQATRWRNHQHP